MYTYSDLNANRSFLYGDGFFETIRIDNLATPLLSFHLQRARKTARFLQYDWPEQWNLSFFEQQIKENAPLNGVARLTFYRNAAGSYAPEEDQAAFHLMFRQKVYGDNLFISEAVDEEVLIRKLSELKLHQGILNPGDPIVPSLLSSYKTTSSLYYVMAARYAVENNIEPLILLNANGGLCESVNSNLLFHLEGEWVTPPISDGPVGGVYLDFLRTFLDIREQSVTLPEACKASLCLTVNAVNGFKRFAI